MTGRLLAESSRMAMGKPQAPSAPGAMTQSARRRESAGDASRRGDSVELTNYFCHDSPGPTSVPSGRHTTSSHDSVPRLGRCGHRVDVAAQAVQVRGLDGLAQEVHVALDLRLVKARSVEVRLGVAVGAVELLLDARARHVFVEAGRLDDQIVGRAVAHDLAAVGELLARDLAPDELLVEELAHLLEVHAIRHLADEIGSADHAADDAVARGIGADLVDIHLVAGEMHQARGEPRLGGAADLWQVARDEVGAAADGHLCVDWTV